MARKKRKQADTENGPIGAVLAFQPSDLDRRTQAYRHYAAIRDAVIVDSGGEAAITETKRQLISRFAAIALWCASQDARALGGEDVDFDMYARIAGHLRRIAEGIGFARIARDVPNLDEYLRSTPQPRQDRADDSRRQGTGHREITHVRARQSFVTFRHAHHGITRMISIRTARARRRSAQRILNNPSVIADSRTGDGEARRLIQAAQEQLRDAEAVIAQHQAAAA
jgi:hypothetical protein